MGYRASRLIALLFTWVCLLSGQAQAYKVNDDLTAYAYMQSWLTLYEQVEDARGNRQNPSGDEAATASNGFSIYKARLGFNAKTRDNLFGGSFQVRLEKDAAILDAFGRFTPTDYVSIQVGQFKIPGPWENLVDDRDLDFAMRSKISTALADYSLTKTIYPSHEFAANNSYQRDTGIGIKGEADFGNGLGANLYIGNTNREYILTNKNEYFYGARLDVLDMFGVLSAGGHINHNKHRNMLYNSGRVVFDLDRLSYSWDARIKVPGTGLNPGFMFGDGQVKDDYYNNLQIFRLGREAGLAS
jgi:hypothetical protein